MAWRARLRRWWRAIWDERALWRHRHRGHWTEEDAWREAHIVMLVCHTCRQAWPVRMDARDQAPPRPWPGVVPVALTDAVSRTHVGHQ